MLTIAQVFGLIPSTTIDLLNEVFMGEYGSIELDNPLPTLNALLNRVSITYGNTFPNGAEHFSVAEKRQNISVDVQRITYTVVFDRQISLSSPLNPVAITPEA